VTLGARVHAVEPARITLEERLLGILRESNSNGGPAGSVGVVGAPEGSDR
jgi:ABC-2 type transport system ATP-binding protein